MASELATDMQEWMTEIDNAIKVKSILKHQTNEILTFYIEGIRSVARFGW